jgi:lipopolysaccharide biosynthesis protein
MTGNDQRKLAISVHAFYPDIFADILGRLDRLTLPFVLFVSYPEAESEKVKVLLENRNYPVIARAAENRGRDIAPFLTMLPDIVARNFNYILKLHTKKSLHSRHGTRWREQLYDYLAEDGQLRSNMDMMEKDAAIGITSHPRYIVPMRTNWYPNEKRIRELAARMLPDKIDIDGDAFVAGSMFLARTAALVPLMNLSLVQAMFEPEQGQKDGTLAHAVERAFTYSARAAGFDLAGAKDAGLLAANYKKFGGKIWKLRLRRFFAKIARD